MVLGRRGLSAILLGIAAIVFYLVLLSTTPSGAQTGGGTTARGNVTQNVNPNVAEPTRSRGGANASAGGARASASSSRKPQQEKSIINIPNKPLPPSGGLPLYGVMAVSALAGTGLLALGLVIRRGSRR